MLLFYLIIFMNLLKRLRPGSGTPVDGWAHHRLRTDSASLSPENHITDTASPLERSAATTIGRVNGCRLVVHSSAMAISAWGSPSIARGANLTPETGPLGASGVPDQREHSLTNRRDAVAVENDTIGAMIGRKRRSDALSARTLPRPMT
jgi:hypothetical protein